MSDVTPGDWYVTGDSVTGSRYVESHVGNGQVQEVAFCGACEFGNAEANARLMAASKDMRAALQSIARKTESGHLTFHECMRAMAEACDLARAALAKATAPTNSPTGETA